MTDEDVRAALFERLTKKGWIAKTWAKQVAPNQVQYKVEYTSHGYARMGELYSLFEERGFPASYLGGELHYLALLAHDWPHETGPAGDSTEPPRRR